MSYVADAIARFEAAPETGAIVRGQSPCPRNTRRSSAFAAPAAFLDLRDRVAPEQPIRAATLEPLLNLAEPGDITVLATGWARHRGTNEEYLKRWPYLDDDGARALLDRHIAGVGIDTLSIGGWGGPEKGAPSHETQLSAGKIVIEELRIPDELIGQRCFLTAFPILLEGCGGAWTRAVPWELV